jgi:prepilin-type N-terminal cleavage/methylation domain-containing protein
MELTPRRAGFTIVELMIALFISLIVVLAIGHIMLVNQASWRRGCDKVYLQQNATEALECMAQSIRSARDLRVVSATQFQTYDDVGVLEHTYRRYQTSTGPRLQEDSRNLSEQDCSAFACTANADTTSVTISLQLQNQDGELVTRETRVTQRNRTIAF